MNRTVIIALLAVWIIAGVAYVAIMAPSVTGTSTNTTASTDGVAAGPSGLPPLMVLGEIGDFTLTERSGRDYSMDDFRGNIWVGAFIFTRCSGSCPVIINRFSQLQEKTKGGDPPLFLACFSVDPDYDTVDVLKRYANAAQADPVRWLFFTGDREKILELAEQHFRLSVGEITEDNENQILHSSKMVLVDKQGQIRGYYEAMDDDSVDKLLRDFNDLRLETEESAE